MKRRTIPYFLLLCGWLIGTLFSPALAAPERGVGVLADGGELTFYNSIVWDNGPGTFTLSGSNNLTGENPLFASETDFLPLAGSPARGAGNNAHWNALAGIARVDIAGVAHGTPINIGAYETDVTYTVTIPSTVTVYLGSKALVSGESVAGGTELAVIANVQAGMKLEVLTANGMPITNGAPFILVANTTFDAAFVPVRKDVYATMKDGTGRLNVYNSIIYDNVDLFGNYTLDATNMIADPKFDSSTHFTLQDVSPAMGLGTLRNCPRA